jgi:hypothetical protein
VRAASRRQSAPKNAASMEGAMRLAPSVPLKRVYGRYLDHAVEGGGASHHSRTHHCASSMPWNGVSTGVFSTRYSRSFQQREIGERQSVATGRERMSSPTLQSLQDPIAHDLGLLSRWQLSNPDRMPKQRRWEGYQGCVLSVGLTLRPRTMGVGSGEGSETVRVRLEKTLVSKFPRARTRRAGTPRCARGERRSGAA